MQAANHHCVAPQQPGTSSPSAMAQPVWINIIIIFLTLGKYNPEGV